MIKLTTSLLDLLKKCLERRNPSLIPLVEAKDYDNYSTEFYNELRQIVGDELVDKGFQSNWEPNEYGLALENLIDEIGRLFM